MMRIAVFSLALMHAPLAFSEPQGVSSPPPGSTPTGFDEPASVLDDFAVTRWQTEEGLPEDAVSGLTLSEDGYLWCLTAKSLARFDGMKFEKVDLPASSNAPSWQGLSEPGPGTLWIYGDSGAYRYGPGVNGPSLWAGASLPAMTPVLQVLQQTNATLWAVVSNGLYQIDRKPTRFFALPDDPAVRGGGIKAAAKDPKGRIWLAVGSAVVSFQGGQYRVETQLEDPVQRIASSPSGRMWAAASTKLFGQRADRWVVMPIPQRRNDPHRRITALLAYGGGEVWVGTTAGLYRRGGDGWSELTPRDGFYPLEIQCIEKDADGNIWAGTSGGLLRLQRRVVQVYDSGLGLLKHAFTAVLPDPAIGLRVGVAGGGLLEGRPGAFRHAAQVPVSRTAVISALLKSKDGALWIGTQGDYLWRCHAGRADCIAGLSREESSAVNINALLEGRQGRIWAGTGNGVMLFDPGKNQLEPLHRDRLSVAAHALIEDREGAVWAGLQGEGLARIAPDGSLEMYGTDQGLPANTVLALCQDADGILWAGTTGGLACWDGAFWVAITEEEGLPRGPVSQILEEGPNLWLGTRHGIALLSRSNLLDVASGQGTVIAPRLFGKTEGMRDEQCSSGFGNLAARDASGWLWFCTADGLIMIDPKRIGAPSTGGGRAYVEEVKAGENILRSLRDGLSHEPSEVTIPAGAGPLSIRFSAPALSAPEQVQFKVMLEGFDPTWSAPTSLRTVAYPRLPPGRYRFRLMAGRGDSWAESLQTLAVEVKPFLWQRRWLWGVTGILALALAGLWARAFEKRRSRGQLLRMEQTQALERERTRIAHDLHDDLGASLTEIGLLSAVAQRPSVSAERAQQYLGDITSKARGVVETLDEIVWAVNPLNDTVTSLGDYFCDYARRILQLTPIRCRLDLASDLPARPLDPDRRHNLFLAFHEALNNVIRHSGAGEALIRIALDNGSLVVSIADDGCGFDMPPSASMKGEGLRSMRHRLEQIGGEFSLTSQAGQGTTIRFVIPLK